MLMLLAVLPAIVLMGYIWKLDAIEKEPRGLLAKLFVCGALTVISAILLGMLGNTLFLSVLVPGSLAYLLVDNFIVTALVEEGGKYFVLKKLTWNHSAFDYSFDAVVYAVAASLGFATLENICYVLESDIGTAIMRAILSVPGHAIDAVFMGSYYGMAKLCERTGDKKGLRRNLKRALWVPVLIHGFYDFCLDSQSGLLLLAFLVFEIIITVSAFRRVNRLSREDQRL